LIPTSEEHRLADLSPTERISVQPVAMSVTVDDRQKSPCCRAFVAYEIDLDEPKDVLVPVCPGPHRDLRLLQ